MRYDRRVSYKGTCEETPPSNIPMLAVLKLPKPATMGVVIVSATERMNTFICAHTLWKPVETELHSTSRFFKAPAAAEFVEPAPSHAASRKVRSSSPDLSARTCFHASVAVYYTEAIYG